METTLEMESLAVPQILKVRKFADSGRSAISLKRKFKDVIQGATHAIVDELLLPIRKSDCRVETTSLAGPGMRVVVMPVRVTQLEVARQKQSLWRRFVTCLKRWSR